MCSPGGELLQTSILITVVADPVFYFHQASQKAPYALCKDAHMLTNIYYLVFVLMSFNEMEFQCSSFILHY